ncbi:MAG: RNA polymerase sigma factor [Planctomycetes bacterium]|nr:RNA polymerase sigma factor [Planctomycetota bacterium]
MFFSNPANEPAAHRTHLDNVRNAGQTDAELATAAVRGERASFEALVDRYLPRVRAFLFKLPGAGPDPDDLTQETFVIVVRSLAQLREPEHVSAWILGIAFRVYKTRNRKFKEDTDGELDNRRNHNRSDPPNDAITREERGFVESAIARLPDRHRDVFLLRHVEEMGAVDAARILSIPEGSVRRLDFEARGLLREWLAPRIANEAEERK